MVTVAFLQYAGSGPMRHEEKLLTEGSGRCGIPIEYYSIKSIHRRKLPLSAETFIAGDMDAMNSAMRQLGIPLPAPDDYPVCLRSFLRRKVWESTLGEVERGLDAGLTSPVFVKPAQRRKRFTGEVFYSERDVAVLGNVSRRQQVWCSEVVRWLVESRVYVVDARIVTVDRYEGDSSVALDLEVVESAIAEYHRSGAAPSAYGIDFGVLETGETALIEVNDGYALGAYDIAADRYTELLMRRWRELLNTVRS